MSPLVSIVTRTLGRPCLADAAASVREQSYRPLEWVVVDASGAGIAVPAAGDVPVRAVGGPRRLLRSPAANVGLRAANGRYLLLLDDDDLLRPDHVAGLVSALAAQPEARLAYSDVEVRTGDDVVGGEYAFEFSRLQLCRRNLFPPHAALFDAGLVRNAGCRVDEALDFFEDWDFWLQVAAHTTFVRVPRRTAIYRAHLSESGVLRAGTAAADPRCTADEATIRARSAAVRAALEADRDRRKQQARSAAAAADLPAAADRWRAAYAIDPYDPEVLTGYAEVALRAGQPAVALTVLERAASLGFDDAALHWNRATVLAAVGRTADAATARARALALDPSLAARV